MCSLAAVAFDVAVECDQLTDSAGYYRILRAGKDLSEAFLGIFPACTTTR
jgi:hypothetical protein